MSVWVSMGGYERLWDSCIHEVSRDTHKQPSKLIDAHLYPYYTYKQQ